MSFPSKVTDLSNVHAELNYQISRKHIYTLNGGGRGGSEKYFVLSGIIRSKQNTAKAFKHALATYPSI